MSKKFVVIGSTGQQGRAVLSALLQDAASSNSTIYAVHRNPASAATLINEYPSIKPIQGNMNNPTAIFRAVGSAPDVVYFMTPSDSKDEVKLGHAIIGAAVDAGTKHIVMSSIDRGAGGNVRSGVDIWDTKHEIEAFLRKQKGITYTIIRPAAYLENFVPGFIGQVYTSVWRNSVNGRKMALVALKDIGVTAAKVMSAAEDYRNAEINLAGDNLTYEEASRIFVKETGGKMLPTANKFLAWILVALMKDLKQMAEFHKEKDTGATVQHDLMNWGAYVRQSEYVRGGKP